MVDRVLPLSLRGALIAHPLSMDRAPGVYVFGNRAYYVFEKGAIVAFYGDVATRRWDRIKILWKGERSASTPELAANEP